MDTPRKRGRPRSDAPRVAHIDVRVTPTVRDACDAAATRAGLALSSWCAIVLAEAARWHSSTAAPGAPQDDGAGE
jgi:predicted HicB family RNase H-like nuclease